nr:hypothetical protein [Tanacetum cinerariifolium]
CAADDVTMLPCSGRLQLKLRGAEDANDKDEDEDDHPFFVVTITQHNFKGSFLRGYCAYYVFDEIVERIGFLYILKVGEGPATHCISGHKVTTITSDQDSKEQKDNKDDLERKKEIKKINLQNLMKLAPFNDAGLVDANVMAALRVFNL